MKTNAAIALAVAALSLGLGSTPPPAAAESLTPLLLSLKAKGQVVKRGQGHVTKILDAVEARWSAVSRRFDRLAPAQRAHLHRLDRLLHKLHRKVSASNRSTRYTLLRKLRFLVRRGESVARAVPV